MYVRHIHVPVVSKVDTVRIKHGHWKRNVHVLFFISGGLLKYITKVHVNYCILTTSKLWTCVVVSIIIESQQQNNVIN